MAARSLEQALQGVAFPCDRARLVDYARDNNLAAPALAKLRGIPQRQYRDLAEVFGALSQAGDDGEGDYSAAETAPFVLPWWQRGWRAGAVPTEFAVTWLRAAADTWPHWFRLVQRLWFPWMK